MLPMPEQTRSLCEIFLANVALVRPDTGVRQDVLIEITAGRKSFLAQDARRDFRLAVLEAFVAHQLPRSPVLLAALVAFEPLFVQPQVVVQSASVVELLSAEVAGVLVLYLAVSLLMPPFVAFHVLHFLPAEPADLKLRDVRPFHVVRQVDLELVAPSTMLADVLRLVVAVSAHVVSLETVLALVLHVANLALEEVVRSMDHFVLLQRASRVTGSFAHVALVRLTMDVCNVVFHLFRVGEAFLAEGTSVSDFVQDSIDLDFVFLGNGRLCVLFR